MTFIVHGRAFNTTALNPPNLNGFGAAANNGVTAGAFLVPEKRTVGIIGTAGTTTLFEVVLERRECTLGQWQTT
jgi:hypothetical protein